MKKVLYSLVTIGFLSLTILYGTNAFFSDSEISSNNKLEAGKLDLKIDYSSTYNGAASTSWELTDLTNEKFFDFATHAHYWFNNGSKEEKRSIVQALGLNLVLEDKKLRFHLIKPFEAIQQGVGLLAKESLWFEPKERGDFEATGYSEPQNNLLWGG